RAIAARSARPPCLYPRRDASRFDVGRRSLHLASGRRLGVAATIVGAGRPRRRRRIVVCPACSIAWGWKSPVQPDGGEGLAKHKGVIARWRLKAVWSKTAT